MGLGDYYNLLGEGTKVVGMNDWALILMNGFSAVLTEISEALTRLSVSKDYWSNKFFSSSSSDF